MFEKDCDNPKCNRGENGQKAKVHAHATSKLGTLPKAYCSTFCEKEAQYDKRIVEWTR